MSSIAQTLTNVGSEVPVVSDWRGRVALAFLVVSAPLAFTAYIGGGCWALYESLAAILS